MRLATRVATAADTPHKAANPHSCQNAIRDSGPW